MGAKNVYGCNAGYYLVGNESRFCNDDGVWSDLQPSCMRKNFTALTLFNIKFVFLI